MSAQSTPLTESDTIKLIQQQRAAIQLLERSLYNATADKDRLFVILLAALKQWGQLSIPRAEIDAMMLDQYRIHSEDKGDYLRVRLLHIHDPVAS